MEETIKDSDKELLRITTLYLGTPCFFNYQGQEISRNGKLLDTCYTLEQIDPIARTLTATNSNRNEICTVPFDRISLIAPIIP